MATPISNTEVFPSYQVLTAGVPYTPTSDTVAIEVADFVAADETELAAVDGNAGELGRSVLLSLLAAQTARAAADRPLYSVVAQQQGTADAGVHPELGYPLATNILQMTNTFVVGSPDGGSIAPELTA